MFSVDSGGISADELMRRVRAEAQRRRVLGSDGRTDGPPASQNGTAAAWAAFTAHVATADATTRVGEQLPAMGTLHGLRRRLAVPVARLILRAAQLVTREQTTFNLSVVGALRAISSALTGHVAAVEQRVDAVGEEMARIAESLLATGQAVEKLAEQVRREVAHGTDALRATTEELVAASRNEAAAAVAAVAAEVHAEAARTDRLRTQLLLQERRIGLLLEEARRAGPDRRERVATAATREVQHLSDALYLSFEDSFRGTRGDIKERARHYVPIVRDARAGSAERPIVDLGCGRGEWLEVLAEEGLCARGIDANEAMVEQTRERGLEARADDALAYLRGLPDETVGAVTGMHIIEHLPFETVLALLDETVRVLKPGGVAIFETPNPRNLQVGACSFWVDPTHRRPVHPDTMAFLAEARGLTRIRVDFLHPVGDGLRLRDDGSGIVARLNELLFGPQDFAVVGYRA